MNASLRLRAYAKINYALSIKGIREDGYHEISTVFQNISLADEVVLDRADTGFVLNVEPGRANVGPTKENTIYRAWELLRELTGSDLPVEVSLYKKIPAGAGLGGASTDAAAFLVGVNELFGLGLDSGELAKLGLRIGADVPFFILGGTALGEGVGEKLNPLPAPPAHYLLLVKPGSGAETASIYRAYDEKIPEKKTTTEPLMAALHESDLGGFAAAVGNDFASVTPRFVSEVAEYEEQIIRSGALGASMSGSGTAVYGIFATEEDAQEAMLMLKAPFAGVYKAVTQGVELLK